MWISLHLQLTTSLETKYTIHWNTLYHPVLPSTFLSCLKSLSSSCTLWCPWPEWQILISKSSSRAQHFQHQTWFKSSIFFCRFSPFRHSVLKFSTLFNPKTARLHTRVMLLILLLIGSWTETNFQKTAIVKIMSMVLAFGSKLRMHGAIYFYTCLHANYYHFF